MTMLSTNTLKQEQKGNSPEIDRHPAASYTMKWRQQQLFLKPASETERACVPQPENLQWLVARLQRSPVQRVSLTPDLAERDLELWANACSTVNKTAYLQLPNTPELPKKRNKLFWWLKRIVDWLIAVLLLLIFGPLMLILALAIRIQSPGPILFSQWRVGERGKLFRILKFRTMFVGAEQLHHQIMGDQIGLHKCEDDPRITPLGRWMRKFSLDELPQLLNVFRGEMSLVGPRPWALYDAVRIHPSMRHRMNALPGITGIWQVTTRSHLRDIDAVNRVDLGYLRQWSLIQDLKILLMTVPKVLTGYGAY
ncbi:sugar transferase [Kovacikia minuta CCNUW1]|uniref:heterocyst development glycosyltransferase HepC n=1 Tax=Kovacikia minuta TaxID=2931930 RepID=UPI001CCB5EB4|nr:heterocyst development glycosyltransferase HepC [Kovacikia minuta]UBF27182.1 sugar transferase [Kovacikia minuta CCNUW1]